MELIAKLCDACIIHDFENSSEMRLFYKVKLERAQGECLWHQEPTKDVTSCCDKLR